MEELLPDSLIGAYRVIRTLGAGGMGTVYEVEHNQLGVHYALKTFMLDHGHVELLRERFLAEGRVLARLRHPNLVRVFDLGIDAERGVLYFVMDLIHYKDGESYTLADLEQGGADEEHLARWFGQICSALDYVHAAGIVHRDIKLNNILLDAHGGVVLSDFGVSRFYGDGIRQELGIGRTVLSGNTVAGNLVMGTAGYMAPEIRRGESATPACDAYSLGVVFFRLLTGVWYEDSANIWQLLDPFADAWREVLRRMLSEDPAMRPIPLAPVAEEIAAACETTATGNADASPRSRAVSRARLVAASVMAALVLGGGALSAWLFFHSDDIRIDDLYSIPAAVPEE